MERPAQAGVVGHGRAVASGSRWRGARARAGGLGHATACSGGAWGTVPGPTALGPADARRARGSVSSAWLGVAGPHGGGRSLVERLEAHAAWTRCASRHWARGGQTVLWLSRGLEGKGWRWPQHPGEAGGRDVRRRATSPTSGQVTVVIVDEPSQDRVSLLCLETERSAPQLLRRWRRRSGMECVFRTLKHL